MRIKPFAALLFALPVMPGLAHAGEVVMLDHTPSVDELRSYLAPDPVQRRTRGIEIVGQPRAQAQPSMATAAATDAPAAPMPMQEQGPAPSPQVVSAPAPQPAAEAAPTTIGYRIPFAYNSAELLPEGRPFLDQLGQFMQSESQLRLSVEGHTDAHGGDAYNMVLSQRRAQAVQGYLAQVWHISPDRLAVIGKGKTEPMTSDPYDGRNRRVQFRPLG